MSADKNNNPNWREHVKAASAKRRSENPDSWDKEKLKKWHWRQGYSIKKIADIVGMSPVSIQRHFKVLGIPVRPGQGVRKTPLNIERDDLYRMYVDEKMSMARIAEHYVCSDNTVRDYLIRYGIPIRSPSEHNYRQRRYNAGLSRRLNIALNHTCTMCGWDRSTCDAHHVTPKHKRGTDEDVILVCPNCHRLAHKGLLEDEEIVRALQKCREALRNEEPASKEVNK